MWRSVCGLRRERGISAASASLSISFCTERGFILRPLLDSIRERCSSPLSHISTRLFRIGVQPSMALTVAWVKSTVRSFSPLPAMTSADMSSVSTSSMSRAHNSETRSPVSRSMVTTG